MAIKNPFMEFKDEPQRISWHTLKESVRGKKGAPDINYPYFMELIMPMQAPTQQITHRGGYLVVAAEILESQETNQFVLIEGDMVIIDLPIRTFARAWGSVAISKRGSITHDNNVQLKFIKRNSKTLFIIGVERTEPTEEQKEFADSIYSKPDFYAPTYVKGDES